MQYGDLDGFSIRTVSWVRPGLCRRSGAPVARSVVPVLVLSMLGSSACKKSAVNRFDTLEGLLVVVRRISLNQRSTAHRWPVNNFTYRRVSSQELRSTRVFADGEAMARLKTKSLETVLARSQLSQKIVEADPCLASISGLHQGLGVRCLFLTA